MTVIRRTLRSGTFVGKAYLGAVDCGDFQIVGLLGGGGIAETSLRLGAGEIPGAPEAETELLKEKRCLFAVRNGESASATLDWLRG